VFSWNYITGKTEDMELPQPHCERMVKAGPYFHFVRGEEILIYRQKT
jgi:hypothetical protein